MRKSSFQKNNNRSQIRVQIVGFGVVGRGLAKALARPRVRDAPSPFRVVAVTDRSGTVYDEAGIEVGKLAVTKEKHGTLGRAVSSASRPWDGIAAIRNVPADILVEVTPTNIVDGQPGIAHISEAMRLGKHVVTANKGPFALGFAEIAKLSKQTGVALKYGGSVCGAVPIIELVRDALVGNHVHSIRGVMNGSCNFILSEMEKTGASFESVLDQARKLGVTETNPSQDIDGWDAASKLVILANALMGRTMVLRDVEVTGIRGVTAEQVRAARKRKRVIRLIATLTPEVACVAPIEIERGSPLAVDGTLNVAVVETDLAKDITIVGRGAGQMETASALLGDLYAIHRERYANSVSDDGARGVSALNGLEVGDIAKKKVVTVDAGRTLGQAVRLMRNKGISQVPVMSEGAVVGTLSERAVLDLLMARGRKGLDHVHVEDAMDEALPEIGPHTPVTAVLQMLEQRPAVLVTRGSALLGIVTRADLLRFVSA